MYGKERLREYVRNINKRIPIGELLRENWPKLAAQKAKLQNHWLNALLFGLQENSTAWLTQLLNGLLKTSITLLWTGWKGHIIYSLFLTLISTACITSYCSHYFWVVIVCFLFLSLMKFSIIKKKKKRPHTLQNLLLYLHSIQCEDNLGFFIN